MKKELSFEELISKNAELTERLEEAEQLIEAIKAGEVDAFALNRDNQPQIFTLQGGDYGYRMLVENVNEGAITLSEEGLIVYTNSYFHELLSLSYDAIIGKSICTFLHPDSKDAFTEILKRGLKGQSKGEVNLYSGDKIIPIYVSLTSLHPHLPNVGVIVTDLTEKKAQQQQLQQKNDELEKMNKELESFAYISSHDLQEPLRKIQTFVSRITEKESGNLSDSGKEMFQRMELAAKRMQTLINDLLSYSRTSSTERKFEKTDLNQILQQVQEDLKDEISEKSAHIETSALCSVNIIPFQFLQMMLNLVGNSLKFSNPAIPPHIKVSSETLESYPPFGGNKACHISVSDNGIGFEPEYNQKIFEVFQQLHAKTAYGGTGIGLSIVKKIVENHNGTITAQSEPNKGATFDIHIPVV
jgi:PAS domain S-box-containing protein